MNFSTVNYIFGAPRSGKTTLLAKLSRQFLKEGRIVYSNFPLKDCILIDDSEVGYFDFGEGNILLLDECGIWYNNRDAFSKKGLMNDPDRVRFWKLVGHYKLTVFLASQGWNDVDLKLRNLCVSYFYIKRWPFGLTLMKPVFKDCDIDDNTHEPTDFFSFDVFFNYKIVIRKRFYQYFDSYDAPKLPPYPVTESVTPTKQGIKWRLAAIARKARNERRQARRGNPLKTKLFGRKEAAH